MSVAASITSLLSLGQKGQNRILGLWPLKGETWPVFVFLIVLQRLMERKALLCPNLRRRQDLASNQK